MSNRRGNGLPEFAFLAVLALLTFLTYGIWTIISNRAGKTEGTIITVAIWGAFLAFMASGLVNK